MLNAAEIADPSCQAALSHNRLLCERLGIPLWMPRCELEGVANPHWVARPAKEHSEHAVAAATAHDAKAATDASSQAWAGRSSEETQAAVAAAELRQSLRAADKQRRPTPLASSDTAKPEPLGAIAPMECLSLFFKNWLFLDDVTNFTYQRSAYLDWQQSLLRSLGLAGDVSRNDRAQQSHSEPEIPLRRLRWPSAADLDQHLARSNNHAARDLSLYSRESKLHFMLGWLRRQQASLGREVEHIVLLGEAPRLLIQERDAAEPQRFDESSFELFAAAGELQALFGEAKVLCAPASRALWSSVDNKRQLWRYLQKMTESS